MTTTTTLDSIARCLAALQPGYRCNDCDWIEDYDNTTYAEAAAGTVARTRLTACPAHRP